MKQLILIAALLLGGVAAQAQKAQTKSNEKAVKEVTFNCNVHCQACEAKIMKNLPYEKGVKDVSVDLDKKQVTVKYRADKNTDADLIAALNRLGYQTTPMLKGDAAKAATHNESE